MEQFIVSGVFEWNDPSSHATELVAIVTAINDKNGTITLKPDGK